MSPDLLLKHFEQISEAPDAVPRLRRFIFDLAVRGKLVPQDPNDEPASELVKRIQTEKARLIRQRKLPKPRCVLCENSEVMLYEVPRNWQWCTLADISTRIHYGYTASANPLLQDVRLLRITDIQKSCVHWNSVPGCEIEDNKSRQYLLADGDILIARTGGTIGKSYLVKNLPVKAIFASYLIRVQATGILFDPYLKVFLDSSIYWRQLEKGSRGAGQPNVNGQTLGKMWVPLPPLSEQHRIVAKVNDLMAMCEELEAAQEKRERRRDRFVASTLHSLNNGASGDEFRQNAGFFLNHLSNLTTRPEHVQQLRQSILNLAVRGKLVPQDPNDEPASKLLKRIQAEKTSLIKEGRSKPQKSVTDVKDGDCPFSIPKSWAWVRLDCLAEKITDGEHLSPAKTTTGMPLLTATHVSGKGVTLNNPQFVSIEAGHRYRKRCDPRRGDILICSRGTIGRCAIVDTDEIFCLMGSVILVRFLPQCSPAYMNYFLSTDRAQLQLRGISGATAVHALYLKDIRLCPIAVPPLIEQHRIVAKVDELMTVCDELEAQIKSTTVIRRRFLETTLHEALSRPPEN